MQVWALLFHVATGAGFAWAAASLLMGHLRTRSRLIRTTGTVVGREDGESRPGVKRRSTVFRFTTEDGQTIETTSSAQTWPGLKVGTTIPVVYDPENPSEGERAGVVVFKLCIAPLILAFGVFVIVEAIRNDL
ncbi:DUF3592 domain-containing protein [Streptomyces sp. NPDC088915]|uniref:DUF3592 domain-containing protein n=1 Tax=Streptomyces sp. NPDC088915 TaxID=3365912 RepID=UPI00382F130C